MSSLKRDILYKIKESNKKTIIFTIIALIIWLAFVIFTETRHEFWRDEIRAFTLANDAGSPIELFRLIRYEGHPILWYLILSIAKIIGGSKIILPIMSILIAFVAVAIFMFYAPFPFWFRILFIFNAFPLYEYSVMARNYGITMLLLFIAAWIYPKRSEHPYLLAIVLSLMANTNVHSIIFVVVILFIWLWEDFLKLHLVSFKNHVKRIIFPVFIVLLGIIFSILTVLPPPDSILVKANQNYSINSLIKTFLNAVFRPDITFDKIVPEFIPSIIIPILFFLFILGLIRKPHLMVSALASYVVMGLSFLLAYNGKFRHQGLFLIFIIFLYWLFNENETDQTQNALFRFFYKGGLLAITILIVGNLFALKNTTWADINIPASASKQFGFFLNNSEVYNKAIIVPEPDYMMESLPYYADNKIFFPRENKFGNVTTWSSKSESYLTLGKLLSTASELKTKYDVPILIVIGHWDIDLNEPGELHYSYNKVFEWNENDIAAFKKSTEFVTEFTPAFTGEKYRVYLLK